MQSNKINGTNEHEALASFLNLLIGNDSEGFDINLIMAAIGDYFKADRAYIFEKDETDKFISNTFEWCREGVTPQIQDFQDVPFEYFHTWSEEFKKNGCFMLINDEEYVKINPVISEILVSQDVHTLIAAPMTLEKEIRGFLGVDNPKEHSEYLLLLYVMAASLYKEIIHERESVLIDQLRKIRGDLEHINKAVETSGIGIWGIYGFEKNDMKMITTPQMRSLMGITDDNMSRRDVYNHWYSNIPAESLESVINSVNEMKEGKLSENTYLWNHPTKGSRYVRCGGISIETIENKMFLQGYHSDVTDIILKEQKTQKDLHDALLEAKKANEAKSTFLARMSHDIRTPLNGIIGLLEISENHPDDVELLKENRKKERIAANHLLSLVNDVLNLSKFSDSSIKLAREPFNAYELAVEVLTIISLRAAEFGITLIHHDCSDQFKYPYIYGSPLHVRQILLNIMDNAIKYNKPGGTISCQAKMIPFDSSHVIYQVIISDTGIGMSKEFLKNLYEPFSQERTDARSTFQGTGLGMSIVKNLVDKMNGDIQVQSEAGKGTVFVVSIPFEIAMANAVIKNPAKEDIDVKGLNILLVEDNELNMEIAEAILIDAGMIIKKAKNGKEAVEVFEHSSPGEFDAIFMDIMMPVMNGYEATKNIRMLKRADAETIPIIAMTANAFDEDIRQAKKSGMNGHISKPINLEIIIKELTKSLNTAR